MQNCSLRLNGKNSQRIKKYNGLKQVGPIAGKKYHRALGGLLTLGELAMLGLARPVGGPLGARQEHGCCPSRSTETEQQLAGGSGRRRQGRRYADSGKVHGDAGTGWSLGSRLRPDPARRGTDQIPKLQDMPQDHDGAMAKQRSRVHEGWRRSS